MSNERLPVPGTRFAWSAVSACLLAAFSTASPDAGAQATRLAPVAVIGTREPTPLARIVGDVTVIDAERIRDSGAGTIEELLQREGGIQLSRNGGPGQSAAILLRGSGASSTLVLVDGVRVGSATLGQLDFAAIGLAQVERIEILRGPASSLYGADAVGGVIHIVTRRGAGAPRLSAHAEVGELHSSVADVAVSGAAGALDYAASLAWEGSRGISAIGPGDLFGLHNPDRDGFDRRNAHLRGGYTLAPGHRVGLGLVENRLRARYDGAEFLPPTFAPDPTPDFRNRLATRIAALDYRGEMSSRWTSTVLLSQQADDLVSGALTTSRYQTRRRQLTWQNAWRPDPDQQALVAVEHLEEDVEATPYPNPPKRRNTALVLGYTGSFGRYTLQVDGRHDRNSAYGDVSTGKAGVSAALGAGFTLRAVAGTAFRAPTFNDLYFPGFGVPTIGPERSRSVEAGLQWRGGASSFDATVYRNRVRDLIAFEADRSFCPPDPAYDFGCARNVARATLEGATLAGVHRLGSVTLRATLDWLEARDDLTGERLPRRAAQQQTLGADWSGGPWSAGATLLHVGARPDAGAQLPAYFTLDLRGQRRLSARWRVEARLLNAFDRRYETNRDYPALGRQAWIGLRYEGAGF
jgi:vitamin B12 transporter